MDIYTRKGDDGTTDTLGQGRRSKDSLLIQALGDLDELNAALGLAHNSHAGGAGRLRKIQSELLTLGAETASVSTDTRFAFEAVDDCICRLEREIDEADKSLPALRDFILPGGTAESAALHFARAVCRRAERSLVALRSVETSLRPEGVKYLNRLSDWLFVMARFENDFSGVSDVLWKER